MSYRRRQQRIAQMHEWYESPSGNPEGMTGARDLWFNDRPQFPGPREDRDVDAENTLMALSYPIGNNIGSIRDEVEWDVGGIRGQTKNVGSTGVTDPQTIDRHDFLGEMAVFRRMPDTNYGPVAADNSGYNSVLSLLYAMQESSHYFPNEVSQTDIIKAV